MKKSFMVSLMLILLLTVNTYSQSGDQSTIKGFWKMFKVAVANEDFVTLKELCKTPLKEIYYDGVEDIYDVEKYFRYGEWSSFQSQVKKISLPKKYKFYSNKMENDFYRNFNVESGSEVYSAGIEGWYWSYADLIIVKIDGLFYIVGDLSMEYEG